MIRMVSGMAIGLVVAVGTIIVMQKIGHTLFPPPVEFESGDTEMLRTYVANMPIGAFVFVLASYFIGTFDGVFVACLVARMKYHVFGVIIGGLMLVATIANLILIPHPHWFSATAVVGIALCAIMAVFLATRALPVREHT